MTNTVLIKDIMTPSPVAIGLEERLSNVIKMMNEHAFDHLPVVDRYHNLIGIISKTDLYRQALQLAQSTSGQSYSAKVLFVNTAAHIMTRDPVTVSVDHAANFAVELLLQGNFHALPVVDGDKLVGIITSKDVLEYIIDQHKAVI